MSGAPVAAMRPRGIRVGSLPAPSSARKADTFEKRTELPSTNMPEAMGGKQSVEGKSNAEFRAFFQ